MAQPANRIIPNATQIIISLDIIVPSEVCVVRPQTAMIALYRDLSSCPALLTEQFDEADGTNLVAN